MSSAEIADVTRLLQITFIQTRRGGRVTLTEEKETRAILQRIKQTSLDGLEFVALCEMATGQTPEQLGL